MAQIQIAQNATPSWAVDVQWPWRYQEAAAAENGTDVQVGGSVFLTANTPSTSGRQLRSFDQAGGGVSRITGYYRGMFGERWQTAGVAACHTWGWLPFFPAIGLAGTFPAGFQSLPHQRAIWVTFTIAPDAGHVLTSSTGVAIINSPAALGVQNWPGLGGGVVANQGGFGIFGDGAGGLNFTAYDNTTPGPGLVLTQVPIPAPTVAGDWQTFEFFITGGSATRDATLDVYVGGTPLAGATQLRFTNAAGGCFWNAALTNIMQLAYRHQTAGAGNGIRFGFWRVRTGWYTRDGVELTT